MSIKVPPLLIALLACTVVLWSCGRADLEEATNSVLEWTAPASEKAEKLAKEELRKLHNFEYKVERVAVTAEPGEMQIVLQELGKDRWECFHVERRNDDLLLFCKRRPESYLRYIPRVF